MWSPAVVGKAKAAGHNSAGTALLVREHLGLRAYATPGVDEGPVAEASLASRLTMGIVEAPGHPQVLAVAAYFPSGAGKQCESVRLRMFAAIGAAQEAAAIPWICGADSNMQPQV